MEKRTCKSYTIDGIDGIKIRIGTTEKNSTKVVYATAKTKINYDGEGDPLKGYITAIKRFDRELTSMVGGNKLFTGAVIATPAISENNLATKKYTKLEYTMFLKVSEPAPMDRMLPALEPFMRQVFTLMGERLMEYGFSF